MSAQKPVVRPGLGVPGSTDIPALPAVLAFAPRAPSPRGFSIQDRIELQRWSGQARALGISRISLEPAEWPALPEAGEFLLLYAESAEWASWGVAPCPDGMVEVWRMRDGFTVGRYAGLGAALERVAAA